MVSYKVLTTFLQLLFPQSLLPFRREPPVTIPTCHIDVQVNRFFPHTAKLWNSLPIECFPLTCDLSGLKSRINRHLLTVVLSTQISCMLQSFCASFVLHASQRLFSLTWSESQLKKNTTKGYKDITKPFPLNKAMKHNKARLGSNNPKIIVAFYIISLSLAKGRSANYPITLNPISLVIQVIQAINCDCNIAVLSASVFYC